MRPYIPYKLPLYNYLIDKDTLFKPTVDANVQIAVFNEKLKSSKVKPELLMNLLSLKEALESSRIEGTQATMDEMLESKADSKTITSDVKEVLNYLDALTAGKYLLNRLPISTRLLKELHSILMNGEVRGNTKAPGEFRSIQNYIGQANCKIENATYIPPEPQLVNDYISNLENFINCDTDEIDPLIKVAIIHSQFETIHPFLDGNGRIGRIIIPLYLYDKGRINSPTLFVSESLERDKFKYYELLNNTRTVVTGLNSVDAESSELDIDELNNARKNYTDWIIFFLNACETEAKKTIDKIDSINSLYETTINSSKEITTSTKIIDLIDIIFETPIFTTKNIHSVLDIAPSTLNGYLNKLVKNKIIFSDNKSRNKKYYFYDLINILR